MKRRDFITLIGGVAVAWRLAGNAQQTGKLPILGLLGSATLLAESQRVAAFVQRLRQLGWIENRNVAIEYRWAEGRSERFVEIATGNVLKPARPTWLSCNAVTSAILEKTNGMTNAVAVLLIFDSFNPVADKIAIVQGISRIRG